MRKFWMVVAIALPVSMGSVFAQAPTPMSAVGAVHEFRSTILSDTYLFTIDTGNGEGGDAADRGQQDLSRLLPAALSVAAGHDDLKASIKAFYVAAKTYFDSSLTPVPMPEFDRDTQELKVSRDAIELKASQAKLKADVDSKANAMQLEAQLAGIDG